MRRHALSPVQDDAVDKAAREWFNRDVVSGGGRFLQFIADERIPAVEAGLRSDKAARCLAGHSAGGLFVCFWMKTTARSSRRVFTPA